MKKLAIPVAQWAAWFDRRALRERILLLGMTLAVGLFCVNALYFHPQGLKRRSLQTEIGTLHTTLAELDRQTEFLKARAQEDPDRENRVRQQQLKAELLQLDERLKDLTVDLIPPQDMAEVLRGLLIQQAGMQLIRLENLPPIALLAPEEEAKEGDGKERGARPNLYRHPIKIVVSGTYLEALAYLRAVEKLPRKVFWDDLEIVVGEHPQTEVSLTVYTLSHRKGWIGV